MTDLTAGLIGHWPLSDDTDDHSSTRLTTRAVDVELGGPGRAGGGAAATFNGQTSHLEVDNHPAMQFERGELTAAAWICTEPSVDVVGSLLSKFDDEHRKGLNLYILTSTGVTSTAQPNRLHLQFGIDDGRQDPAWSDCGRPGNAVLINALTVSDGLLYAGTLEIGADEMGHLYRYDGGQKWVDLGNPLGCNGIHSVVEFDGALYCGMSRYHCAGSVLGETLNTTPGGKVFRVDPDGGWRDCGHPGHEDATPEEADGGKTYTTGKADDVMSLSVYHGQLYCVSSHRLGVHRYEGGQSWKYLGPELRIISLAVYRDRLYALINGGPVYRFEAPGEWTHCGHPEGSRQTYSAVTYQGRMYVGTWPEGAVFRYEGDQDWQPLSRRGWVGYEREIMAMTLYNGKVYAGGLPMANVYRMDGEGFSLVGNLDSSTAMLRRVWSMAILEGKLYAGTLPSGHVRCFEAGKMATADRAFPHGWRHVAAVKDRRKLRLYVDGRLAASSSAFHPADYDLSNDQPLQIGFGAFEHFRGQMSDVRLYGRALTDAEVAGLACR